MGLVFSWPCRPVAQLIAIKACAKAPAVLAELNVNRGPGGGSLDRGSGDRLNERGQHSFHPTPPPGHRNIALNRSALLQVKECSRCGRSILLQYLRQLGGIHRNLSRLIFAEQLGCIRRHGAPSGILLIRRFTSEPSSQPRTETSLRSPVGHRVGLASLMTGMPLPVQLPPLSSSRAKQPG
jgi:hypothetical protein